MDGQKMKRLLVLSAALWAALGAPSTAVAESPGHAMRRARQALSVDDDHAARRDLEAARRADPAGARGLEATLLLADMDFRLGNRAAAEELLDAAADAAGEGFGKATVGIARAWLALATGDGAKARAIFASVASNQKLPVAGQVCTFGSAWADLVAKNQAPPAAALVELIQTAPQPGFRYAAGLTVAWLHQQRGENAAAVRRLRQTRRAVRDTSYEDDAELALGLGQLRAGQPHRARATFRRLDRRFGTTATSSPAPLLSLRDLNAEPHALTARLADLFAARERTSTRLFHFLGGALDRRAGEDVGAALALADAAIAARGGAHRG